MECPELPKEYSRGNYEHFVHLLLRNFRIVLNYVWTKKENKILGFIYLLIIT